MSTRQHLRRIGLTLAGSLPAAGLILGLTAGPAGAADEADALTDPDTMCPSLNIVGDQYLAKLLTTGAGQITASTKASADPGAGTPLADALLATGVQKITYDVAADRTTENTASAAKAVTEVNLANPGADCTFVAIGLNDIAELKTNPDSGSYQDRIAELTDASGQIPLAITTIAVSSAADEDAGYTSSATREWNDAVSDALPAMNVVDIRAHAKKSHLSGNGLDPTRKGVSARAELIARALAGDPTIKHRP